MRTDENLSQSFRASKKWKTDAFTGAERPELDRRVQDGGVESNGQFLTHSHSGHESNHLFLSNQGREFADISTLSGLDTEKDSRGFALFDFDRDGWQDIALVNANAPLLNLFHNQVGQWPSRGAENTGGMIALRFVGGNQDSKPSSEWSARDGYGARIRVALGDKSVIREHQCGEGFAVQNSSTMIIGIGRHEIADAVHVRWQSGKTTTIENVKEGTLLTVFEKPPDGSAAPFVAAPYRTGITLAKARRNAPAISLRRSSGSVSSAKLRVYTTLATWCAACLEQYPQLELLKTSYGTDVEIYGMPVDPDDTPEKLRQYQVQRNPPYKILVEPSAQDRKGVQTLLEAILKDPALPSTFATDSEGHVLQAWMGVPMASDIARLLVEASDE